MYVCVGGRAQFYWGNAVRVDKVRNGGCLLVYREM